MTESPQTPVSEAQIAVHWREEGYVDLDDGTRWVSELQIKPIAPEHVELLENYFYWRPAHFLSQ